MARAKLFAVLVNAFAAAVRACFTSAGVSATSTGSDCGGSAFSVSGAGANKLIVLPYRNLVIVHRVDTFQRMPTQLPSQVGRLLWLILDAAGEKDIGENPSIVAAKDEILTSDQLRKIMKNGTSWVGVNTGPIPGGDTIFISCLKNGKSATTSRAGV